MSVIVTENLTRYYKDLCAVDHVDLEVGREIFGLLGPNGAGKSTIVKMLTTLLRPSDGRACVCGHDVVKDAVRVRESISYVPQEMALDIKLTGRENVVLFARLYGVPNARDRTDEALGLLGLADRADELVRGYSGGMRRRLELAQALVHEPRVLFLDEPTLGLDVAAREKIWEHVHALKEKGMTIFMTTHYMDEADRYCDRVAIIDRGKISAIGTPQGLKGEIGRSVVTASVSGEPGAFSLEGVRLLKVDDHELVFMAGDGADALAAISQELKRQGLEIHSLSVRETSLDDVFLQKVGTPEDRSAFDGSKYRLMLRRR
ncbi:MAG: Trehalose/maltose import ATP-binding protein MalK [Methanocella sp. PtaU1.Bin125]|nr:MAG: Trehalose/maltose import ATP-binding protein MalK [Methanocella sp. PtaU1.Bin125]